MSERLTNVDLTDAEIELLLDGLDSHEYWELSGSSQRWSGSSTIEDGENVDVDAVRQLIRKLERHSSSATDRVQPTRAP